MNSLQFTTYLLTKDINSDLRQLLLRKVLLGAQVSHVTREYLILVRNIIYTELCDMTTDGRKLDVDEMVLKIVRGSETFFRMRLSRNFYEKYRELSIELERIFDDSITRGVSRLNNFKDYPRRDQERALVRISEKFRGWDLPEYIRDGEQYFRRRITPTIDNGNLNIH